MECHLIVDRPTQQTSTRPYHVKCHSIYLFGCGRWLVLIYYERKSTAGWWLMASADLV